MVWHMSAPAPWQYTFCALYKYIWCCGVLLGGAGKDQARVRSKGMIIPSLYICLSNSFRVRRKRDLIVRGRLHRTAAQSQSMCGTRDANPLHTSSLIRFAEWNFILQVLCVKHTKNYIMNTFGNRKYYLIDYKYCSFHTHVNPIYLDNPLLGVDEFRCQSKWHFLYTNNQTNHHRCVCAPHTIACTNWHWWDGARTAGVCEIANTRWKSCFFVWNNNSGRIYVNTYICYLKTNFRDNLFYIVQY